MVDARILKAHGCSADAWKKIFEGKEFPHPPRHNMPVTKKSAKRDKIDELIERIWQRVKNGRDWNFGNFSTIHAMDLIWDAPFRQVSPTLIASICEKHGANTDEVKNALTGLGLNLDAVLWDTGQKDPKTGQPIMAVNVPSFFAITVPMVRALLTTRRSKIVNDRNREPFFEYKAATQSKKNRVRCEVITSRVQNIAKDYDYYGVMNQAVLQMFLYPTGCLAFTKEEWDYSEQLRTKEGGKEEKFREREGLRFHTPHPGRMFWDVAHPLRTFNTDTGCTFAGYWDVVRYGDILDNEGCYNTDKISIGDTGWFGTHWFWRTVYSTCVPKIPVPQYPAGMSKQADREQWLADNQHYNGDMREASVMRCEYREKLNPKLWGLGDYDHDIWCRFVTAGDGTIIYAAPLCYTPVAVFKDNGDDKRLGDATLALQLAPYQDMLSNLLSQLILSVKQNLANLTLVEKSVVTEESLKKLINQGEAYYRAINYQRYDAKDLARLFGGAIPPAIISHRFPPQDINGIFMAMKTVIDMAERVLQFSAQEIAQAASHEQTKREVDVIHQTTNNIIEYTGTAVDAGLNAIARMTYEALMNHGDDEFYAQIPSDHELSEKQLTELGITQDEDGETKDKKIRVKAKKSAMELDSFATVPPATKRETNWEAAQALAQFWASTLADPEMKMALGPKQLVEIANKIAKLAGLKLDTELRDMTEQNKKKAASDLLKETVDAVLGIVRTETKQGLEPIMSALNDGAEVDKALTEKIAALYEVLGATATSNPPAGPAGSGGPPLMAEPAAVPVVPAPLADPVLAGPS